MNSNQYREWYKGKIKVIFYCKNCTESRGIEYIGKVTILNPACLGPTVDLIIDEENSVDTFDDAKIIEDIIPLLTPPPIEKGLPPPRRIVDYSFSSSGSSLEEFHVSKNKS